MASDGSGLATSLLLTVLGGGSTALGGLLAVIGKPPSTFQFGICQGAAGGLMLFLSFVELLPESVELLGPFIAQLWFFAGVAIMAFVVYFIPEPDTKELFSTASEVDDPAAKSKDKSKLRKSALMSGILLALGLTLHNLPEGMAVFLTASRNLKLGVSIAIAIAFHNIPEGVAVAMPIYFATRSKWKAFCVTLVSGMAEPLGTILVYIFFIRGSSLLTSHLIDGILALVAGIMTFLSLYELIPQSIEFSGKEWGLTGVFIGMAVVSVSMYALSLTELEH